MTEPEKKEQSKPLAPAAHRFTIPYKHDPLPTRFTTRPTRKCIKLCGCCTAILLIILVIILILSLTIFHVRDPILNMNFVAFERVDALNATTYFRPGHNLTLFAEVSIKNRNAASLKINDTTTCVYYNGSYIGEGKNLEGKIKARRTLRTNVTIDVRVDKILEVPRFSSDLDSRMLAITTYTIVNGKVKIMNVVRRSSIERINCTMNVNMSSLAIEDLSCRRWVSL